MNMPQFAIESSAPGGASRPNRGFGAHVVQYAQSWEDADVLLEALDVRPWHVCLSIASAGDNTLALLARSPARVVALDLNPAQLACLELRVAAYRELRYHELLELLGSLPSGRRAALYRRCRSQLSAQSRSFWDARDAEIEKGAGAAGRFERYLACFRARVLPLIHPAERVRRLLEGGTRAERDDFYAGEWDTWRWRMAFSLFFSRALMSLMGRDPAYFRHAQGSIASHLLERARHGCTSLDPANNPYLQWILAGRHVSARPFALRAENFDLIRMNLDRLEWRCSRFEDYLAGEARGVMFDRCNLSDVFEYMSAEEYTHSLEVLLSTAAPHCRLAYWNLVVPRRRPDALAARLRPLEDLSARLHGHDKAFFYSRFVVEEAIA